MNDKFTQHVATVAVVVAMLGSLGASIWQVTQGHTADAQIFGVFTLCLGILCPSPVTRAVTVDNAPSDPIPTAPVDTTPEPVNAGMGAGVVPAPAAPADGGFALVGLIGAIIAVIGAVWLILGAVHHALDVVGLILLLVGIVILWFGQGRRVL